MLILGVCTPYYNLNLEACQYFNFFIAYIYCTICSLSNGKLMHNISFICVHKINVVLPPLSEGAYIWKVEGVAINISMSSNN